LRNKEWVCLRLSQPMEWFSYAVWPAVRFFELTVGLIMSWGERRWKKGGESAQEQAALQELRAIAALARMSRLIGVREERIILSAVRLSSTPIRSVMLPAQDISMLDADASLSDALIAAHQDMHTRFPVTEEAGDPQQIVGYANFKDIVACLHISPERPALRAVIRRLPRLNAEMSVAECLEKLIREYAHIALVTEPDGKVVGMITMEDVLEELVGEIGDEYDRLPSHLIPVGDGWIVGGNTTLQPIRDVAGIQLPAADGEDLSTVNQWVQHRLGRAARGGDQISVGSLRILVRKVRRQSVQEAQLLPTTPPRKSVVA
jgi:putative hemolysin